LSPGEVLESVLALGREGLQNPRLFFFIFFVVRSLGQVLVSRTGACVSRTGERCLSLGEVLGFRRGACL
jgi:hypothetical protein